MILLCIFRFSVMGKFWSGILFDILKIKVQEYFQEYFLKVIIEFIYQLLTLIKILG